MQASYTWSKDLGDVNGSLSGANEANSGNPMYLTQQYGPAYFNHPQRLIMNYSLRFALRPAQWFRWVHARWMEHVRRYHHPGRHAADHHRLHRRYNLRREHVHRAEMCPGAIYGSISHVGREWIQTGESAVSNHSGAFCQCRYTADRKWDRVRKLRNRRSYLVPASLTSTSSLIKTTHHH